MGNFCHFLQAVLARSAVKMAILIIPKWEFLIINVTFHRSQNGALQANQFAGGNYAGLGFPIGRQASGGAIAQVGGCGFSFLNLTKQKFEAN